MARCWGGSATPSPRCTPPGSECRAGLLGGDRAWGADRWGLPARPTLIPELQAASAVGQGKLYRSYDELLRARGLTSGQVLLDRRGSRRAHAIPQRAPHLAHAAGLAGGAGDQRERHHRHRRDLLRRQRLPRRAGRRAGRRRAAGAAHRHRRPAQRRPAHGARRAADRRGARLARAARTSRSATPPRRWARGGCARRCSPRRSRAPPGSPP